LERRGIHDERTFAGLPQVAPHRHSLARCCGAYLQLRCQTDV